MAPATPPPPDPGSLGAVIRPAESITVRSPCRLRTAAGRVNTEVAILSHKSSTDESAVLVVSPPTSKSPLRILYSLPITSTFSASLMQIPPSPSTSFFAQSSKPHIELMLSTGENNGGRKVELQFPAADSARVHALMKEIRKTVDVSIVSPFSHAWLSFYPEVEGDVAPLPTDTQAMEAKIEDSLEASFGNLGTTDDDNEAQNLSHDTEVENAKPVSLGEPVRLAQDDKESKEDVKGDDEEMDEVDLIEVDEDKEEADKKAVVNGEAKHGEEASSHTPVANPVDTAKQDSDTENSDTTSATSSKAKKKPEIDVEPEEENDDDDDDKFPNPYTPGFSRTDFLRKRLFKRQKKWSSTTPVRIRIVTYNVNDRTPPTGTKELGPIVGYGGEDILVVGLQEVDLRGQALLLSQGSWRADAWEEAILAGLGDRKDSFEKIACVQYVGVLMLIFVKSELRPDIRMLQETSRGIGLLGFGGNKAGVAVRMKVHDTTIAFVNSHLAAFTNQLERRRLDYQALLAGLNFTNPVSNQPATEAHYSEDGSPLGLTDSDVLFWFGDLNYRIDLEDAEIRALCETDSWDTILTADQLLGDIAENLSFGGFSEPRIVFKPSFKYVHGSVTMDPKRSPAYTDRILHITHGPEVVPSKYTSHELLWSDHLPVSSRFMVRTRVVDEAKRTEELVAIQCELDKLDELYRASLEVDSDEVDFGLVKYRREVKREFTLRNTGLVDATFSFRVPSPGKPICKPWFWPFPSSGVVGSGQELKLTMTALVDESHAGALTGGEDMLDVLVLQVDGGTDTFLSLRAQFEPSIINLPLEVLPDLPSAIVDVPLTERKTLLHPTPDEGDAKDASKQNGHSKGPKPPREIWRLLELLMSEGMEVENLWTSDVDLSAVLATIDALDKGDEKLPCDAKVAAQTLLHILYALPSPLIPDIHRTLCTSVKERDDAFGVLEKVPSVHANVLIGVTSVVRLCCGAESPDDAIVKAIATAVFGGAPAGREGFVRVLLEG